MDSVHKLSSLYVKNVEKSRTIFVAKREIVWYSSYIVIRILNERNSYHSVGRMKFENSKENEKVDMGYILEEQYVTDDLEMHFIELPKFRKKNPDISSKLDQWLWLICGEEEKIKMAKNENEKIKEAKSELEKLEMSAEDRELYELRLKAIRDEINIRESGYIDGQNEEKTKIAKNMLKENMSIEVISKLTGLSQEEIEKLKN